MAVVLRSNSDLAYLPDHGFVGEEGALRILVQVTRRIRRLDVSHNLLGPSGTLTLFRGLASHRSRYNSPHLGEIWGLREVNLGCNTIDDEALDTVMAYAKKDGCLRKVLVQANEIELRDSLESIVNSLNASRIATLSLTNNKSLLPSSITQLFRNLSAPHLTELHLSTCDLGPSIGREIATFLSSPRARNIETLELNGNCLGVQGVRAIVDAIEQTNFTIKQVGLLSNDTRVSAGDDIEEVQETRDREEIQAEERALAHHVHQRLPVLLERNRFLTRRVKRAATRVIGPARMLLNARPMSDHEIARRMISTGPTIPFRILDLPREVLYNIVRQCSRDPTALSEAQFARIRAEAEDGESLGRLRRMTRLRSEEEASQGDEWVKWEIREDWLRRGRWDKWELDQPVAPFGVVT